MWQWIEKPAVQAALLAVLAGVLVLLGVLQYRSAEQETRIDEERMRRRIEDSSRLARREVNLTLIELANTVDNRLTVSRASAPGIARRLENWIVSSPHADLFEALYVVRPAFGDAPPQLWHLDVETQRFQDADWTDSLRRFTAPTPRRPGPDEGLRRVAWLLDAEENLLARRFLTAPDDVRGLRDAAGWIVIALNGKQLHENLINHSVARYFESHGEREFVVAVAPRAAEQGGHRADFSSPLLWGVDEYIDRYRSSAERAPQPGRPPPPGWRGGDGPERAPDPSRGFPGGFRNRGGPPTILAPWSEDSELRLTVTHRAGSVEQAMAAQRRRNLFFGFAVLGVLATALMVVVLSSRRAARLAQMQMDFVAGVSHELRTPLAVIRAAGENLADGVIASEHGVAEYGALIRDEGRRLSRMVENTLQFSASNRGFPKLETSTVHISPLFESVASQLATLTGDARITLERDEPPAQLAVRADPNLLRQCLLNLIENALKYSGDANWVRLSASVSAPEDGRVTICVEDRGAGIDHEDLPHIFEAFYRGARARDAQIQGSGLGLKITKDAIQAMGGRIEVESQPGHGSKFRILLPAAKAAHDEVPSHVLTEA